MNFNFDFQYTSSSFYSGLDISSPEKDLFFSDDEENEPKPRLPLFRRCPFTNQAFLDSTPSRSAGSQGGGQVPPRLLGDLTNRIPLLQISNHRNLNNRDGGFESGFSKAAPASPKKISWSQVAKKPAAGPLGGNNSENLVSGGSIFPSGTGGPGGSSANRRSPVLPTFEEAANMQVKKRGFSGVPSPSSGTTAAAAAAAVSCLAKPSLDDVKDDSLVALTNKHGKGKYWFKSGCPTPDPRWNAKQQLMIGPIPGDVEYATLRSAFLCKGHTAHLFIQNNQAWLEKNQEKFGKKQVKFGYVVYTDPEVAKRLLSIGHVMVGHAKVKVKEMDGQPAVFNN